MNPEAEKVKNYENTINNYEKAKVTHELTQGTSVLRTSSTSIPNIPTYSEHGPDIKQDKIPSLNPRQP
jgi:hypothetical protein